MKTYSKLSTDQGEVGYYSLKKLANRFPNVKKLPFSIKILLESLLRNYDDYIINKKDIANLANYKPKEKSNLEFAFRPARVLMQDFTGIPAVVDLAAMRNAMHDLDGDPKKINPLIPVELIIDHSVQVDNNGPNALKINIEKEFKRNHERYEFLKWGQKSFQNFKVVPPAQGIIHQINLENLAKVVVIQKINGEKIAYPDSVVGTDSHTTMINGLSVLGWGVGGIEAEAVMLGQAIYMLPPAVVGVKLEGKLPKTATATDLVLTIVQMLRKHGVVAKFVEFYGSGIKTLSLADRATIANMAPEYGATMGFFPTDEETLNYLRLTGREEQIDLVEKYAKEQGIFYENDNSNIEFSENLSLDISSIKASLAGPKKPQDRIEMAKIKKSFSASLINDYKITENNRKVQLEGSDEKITHGSLVIAAITSCTNTSNPSVLIAAGLLAKKAVKKGLKVPSHVKTSFGPGSKVVTAYLKKSGLLQYFEQLGFNVVGYGCTSCIGNSGPIAKNVKNAVEKGNLIVTSISSGNRNFEGRINPVPKANYLASPPLVIAFALSGKINIDMDNEAIGNDKDGNPIFLKDIWPSREEIQSIIKESLNSDQFKNAYTNVFKGPEEWDQVQVSESDLYDWDDSSTYIKLPTYFEGMQKKTGTLENISEANVLIMAGDSTTTDHISPAGAIAKDSPAADYLREKGVNENDFNSYGSRRGNHEIMMRGTFANVRFKNLLTPDKEGSSTLYFPEKKQMNIYNAAMKYKKNNIPVIILAGKDYGMGSSRDWAAKGPALLGVKIVIAETYERIHRSNLIGMGVLPLQFKDNENTKSLGLDGSETYNFKGLSELKPSAEIEVIAKKEDGTNVKFKTISRVDTLVEVDYIKNGGILQTVIRQLLK